MAPLTLSPRRGAACWPPLGPALAVRHNRQPSLAQELLIVLRLPIAKRIFVILAQAADIRLDRHLNSGANLHPVTISIAGMKSIGNECIQGQTQDYKGCGQDDQTETFKRVVSMQSS